MFGWAFSEILTCNLKIIEKAIVNSDLGLTPNNDGEAIRLTMEKLIPQLTSDKRKTWIVGKWITPREQRWASPGTHFHQFVVPQIFGFRRDCTYGELAAMKLPEDVQGLGMCEYTMERGVVHACHAGGVVHFLEGWGHHEVGAIDVDRIDVVWAAALKHGLKPVN